MVILMLLNSIKNREVERFLSVILGLMPSRSILLYNSFFRRRYNYIFLVIFSKFSKYRGKMYLKNQTNFSRHTFRIFAFSQFFYSMLRRMFCDLFRNKEFRAFEVCFETPQNYVGVQEGPHGPSE